MTGKSTFVPNSFQTPNDYVDEFMPFLTGEEYKVLIYATRRILGFQKRQDRISLSQFTDGTKSIKDGRTLDSGTGLGKETVKNCLDNLVKFGLMVKVADNDPRTNEGTLWSLQWNEDEVNWKELQNHLKKRSKVNAARMAKARSVRQTAVGETDRTPSSGTDRGGASGTGTQNPGLETQGKEDIEIKESCLQILESFSMSIFGNDIKGWWNIRRTLKSDRVSITGDNKRMTITGLSEKVGQFSLAEVWSERYAKPFANLGLELEFRE